MGPAGTVLAWAIDEQLIKHPKPFQKKLFETHKQAFESKAPLVLANKLQSILHVTVWLFQLYPKAHIQANGPFAPYVWLIAEQFRVNETHCDPFQVNPGRQKHEDNPLLVPLELAILEQLTTHDERLQ